MDAERTGKRGPHQADTPPRVGNYVTARVGNYVTDNPSNLGKYVTADTMHDPRFFSVNVAGFSSGLYAKAWLTTAAAVLALFQVFSALVMYGRLPITPPSWIGTAHAWLGRLAVLATVPVAVHCLYAVGFQTGDARVLTHSLLGCFFYGAFVAKMLVLSRKGMPGWALPVLGGAVFTGLIYLWLTSALWLFTGQGLKF